MTVAETKLGWVEFMCDRHGFLVATTKDATVWCRCGKRARASRHGRLVDPDTLKPTEAKARELNKLGQPYIHGCADCGEDFGGTRLQERHRAGGVRQKRCLTPDEMEAKGWRCDSKGRWRDPSRPVSETRRLAKNSGQITPNQPLEPETLTPGSPRPSEALNLARSDEP